MGYTYDRDGKRTGYTPGKKTLYHDKTGEGHNMGYDEYMIKKKLAADKKKLADELEAIRKFQADAKKANREEVVDDSQHTPMTNPFSPMSDEMRNRLRKKMEAKYSDTDDSEDYSIDHLLVGTPSNPVDFNELRKIAVEKHRKKYVPTPFDAASIASEMAAAQPEINTEDLIKEVVASGLAEYKYDKDYQEGLDRWASENSKVEVKPEAVVANIPTPKFKVGMPQFIGKNFSGGSLQNDFISPSVSLPGMSEVTNSGTIGAPTEETPTTEGKDGFSTEDTLSTLLGFVPHPAAQAFSTLKTIKDVSDFDYKAFYNKYIK